MRLWVIIVLVTQTLTVGPDLVLISHIYIMLQSQVAVHVLSLVQEYVSMIVLNINTITQVITRLMFCKSLNCLFIWGFTSLSTLHRSYHDG